MAFNSRIGSGVTSDGLWRVLATESTIAFLRSQADLPDAVDGVFQSVRVNLIPEKINAGGI